MFRKYQLTSAKFDAIRYCIKGGQNNEIAHPHNPAWSNNDWLKLPAVSKRIHMIRN